MPPALLTKPLNAASGLSGTKVKESMPDVAASSESDASESVIQALKAENKRLRDLVTARKAESPSWCGYLYKYRPRVNSLLQRPWELRFVVVSGQVLQYYKTEKDTIFHPRGHIDLAGTIVEVEGLKNHRYWTFGVVDRSGLSLIRLSSENQAEAQKWVDALVKAGCERRELTRDAKERSPLRSADVRWETRSGSPALKAGTLASQKDILHRYSPVPGGDRGASPAPSGGEGPGYTSDSQASEATERLQRRRSLKHPQRTVMIASTPVHMQAKASLLSSERVTHIKHSGLINLGMIIILAANSRLIIENLLKYGIRFNPAEYARYMLTPSGNWWLAGCWAMLFGFVFMALLIEKLALVLLKRERLAADALAKKGLPPQDIRRKKGLMGHRTEQLVISLHIVNIIAELLVPCGIMEVTRAEPLPALALVTVTVVWWLKLVSYVHMNWDLRNARRFEQVRPGERGAGEQIDGVEEQLQYPENLTLKNLGYFLLAPTLCYQTSYPTNTRFRLRWFVRRLVELLVYSSLLLFITVQYVEPTIHNSLAPLQNMDWVHCAERLLKLALPTLYFWLVMFYLIFHVWLNLLAEVTGFADREFYKDWWNATTIGEYWRLWNQPVHKWMLRHVYFPLNRLGISKPAAGIVVFFVSAVFHELLVGIPLHMLRAWAFLGMMGQVPMMWLTDALKRSIKNDIIGNVIFWTSFCFIGQPLSIMLYYHDYVINHSPTLQQQQYAAAHNTTIGVQ